MGKSVKGILLMTYGTPTNEEEIETYFQLMNHGNGQEKKTLQLWKERFQVIGDGKAIQQITWDQAAELLDKLNELNPAVEYKTYLGYHSFSPTIEAAMEKMAEDGVTEAISVVLSPLYSMMTVKDFNERAVQTAKKLGIQLTTVTNWYKEQNLIWYWVNGIREVMDDLPFEGQDEAVVIFSAQSLPDKSIEDNDPYPQQMEEMAVQIADAAGIFNYDIGWQGEGDSLVPWLGPDVEDLTRILFHEMGHRTFIYAPIGYVQDQLEILYDLDVRTQAICHELGASYHRVQMPNTHPLFIEALADVILAHDEG